jgi:protein TIF31
VTKIGFPRKFRHKLCSLRQELIESFVDAKYIQFVKHAAIQIQQMNSKKAAAAQKEAAELSTTSSSDLSEQEKEIEEAKKIVKELASASVEENSVQIIQNACKHVNSYKDTEFDIRFNPNLFQPIVKLADELEKIEADKKLLNEACEYLLLVQVPLLIKDLLDHAIFITDGVTLCETLHSRGINLRYLGHVLEQIAKYETLSYVFSIGMCELVSRCAKRIFRQYIQGVSGLSLSAAVAHYLNSYLSLTFKSNGNVTTTNLNGSPPNASNGQIVSPNETESTISKTAVKKSRKKNQKKNARNSFQGNFFCVS